MKLLIVIAITIMGSSLLAQDVKFDMWIKQRNQEYLSKPKVYPASYVKYDVVRIVENCHDVSSNWLDYGVEERITYEFDYKEKVSVDFDYIDACLEFQDYLSLNGPYQLRELDVDTKIKEIKRKTYDQ